MSNLFCSEAAQTGEFTDIELGDLTPGGTARAPPASLPKPAGKEAKKNIIRRTCLDPMKAFCERYPTCSIIIFILFITFCLVMSIVLLSLSMGIFLNPMTDEMREGVANLPGFNKGIYRR
ncbi:hypothetical protein WAI453_005131 [Rhynchosporium graminicola]